MSASSIVSRDWDDVVGSYDGTASSSLGTSTGGVKLLEPQRGFAAFSTTFRYMFREEWRENIDFAKKRQVVLFPLLLTLVTMVTTVGLQFLVGDSAANLPTWMRNHSHGINFDLLCTYLFCSSAWEWERLRSVAVRPSHNVMATRTTSLQHQPFSRCQTRWPTTHFSSRNWSTTLC